MARPGCQCGSPPELYHAAVPSEKAAARAAAGARAHGAGCPLAWRHALPMAVCMACPDVPVPITDPGGGALPLLSALSGNSNAEDPALSAARRRGPAAAGAARSPADLPEDFGDAPPQTRKSPMPVPPIPDLAGKRGGNPR